MKGWHKQVRLGGATVARLTPVQKVASSNQRGVKCFHPNAIVICVKNNITFDENNNVKGKCSKTDHLFV